MMRNRSACVFLAVCFSWLAAADASLLTDLEAQVARARRDFDLAAAELALEQLKGMIAQDRSPAARQALIHAALIVAELNRYDFEVKDLPGDKKRALGEKIDAAAELGIATLGEMPPSSEKYRMMADFWGTMIRSKYKGKRLSNKMEDAIRLALEADPDNPNAHVSACKRELFAEVNQGGNVPKALEQLNRALSLDPKHEPALILRGIAYEKLGEHEKARADWEHALSLNPACRPAKEKLSGERGPELGALE